MIEICFADGLPFSFLLSRFEDDTLFRYTPPDDGGCFVYATIRILFAFRRRHADAAIIVVDAHFSDDYMILLLLFFHDFHLRLDWDAVFRCLFMPPADAIDAAMRTRGAMRTSHFIITPRHVVFHAAPPRRHDA